MNKMEVVFMLNLEKVIKENNLLTSGDVVGVAVSGGADSMTLLHYLNSVKQEAGISLVAITINHGIRLAAKHDVEFVLNFCEKHNIKFLKFEGDVPSLAAKNKKTIEQQARDFRYGIFNKLLSDKRVTKIALGHHLQDQAETVLLNIFRGSSLVGASGMEIVRDGAFIRPLLKTSKSEILAYCQANDLPYVEDETNQLNDYARNYLRNQIMPLIRNRWKNADQIISNFADLCRKDEEYIQSTIHYEGLINLVDTVKIPATYFVWHDAARNRMLLHALKSIGAQVNIENKHLDAITNLALSSNNGASVNLKGGVSALKEYNFVTLTNKKYVPKQRKWAFKAGRVDVAHFGVLEIKRTKNIQHDGALLYVDYKKVPKNAVWRYGETGDTIEKFGGGTKPLNRYLIDKKVPRRVRTFLPVLAADNEILVVPGVGISEKVKIDDQTKTVYSIMAVQF